MRQLALVVLLFVTACVTPIPPTPVPTGDEKIPGIVPDGYIQMCQDQPESILCEEVSDEGN